jgi:myo-inositol 2-dehydrogenase/D-chiro-inositol 1-dehydrogenase
VSAAVDARPLGVALVGAGRMGVFHAETLARRLPGARLAGVADPAPGAAGPAAGVALGSGVGSGTEISVPLPPPVTCGNRPSQRVQRR